MKLSIKPVQEHRNRVFTSADVVVGVIYLDVNDSITISRIQFSLKGRSRRSAQGRTPEVSNPPPDSTTAVQRSKSRTVRVRKEARLHHGKVCETEIGVKSCSSC